MHRVSRELKNTDKIGVKCEWIPKICAAIGIYCFTLGIHWVIPLWIKGKEFE